MLNERERLARGAEGVVKFGLVRGFGTRHLVRCVRVVQTAWIETSLRLSVTNTVPLLLFRVLGAKVILESVECRLG